MQKSFNLVKVSMGFSAYLWLVSDGTTRKVVHALNNYDAAEACGLKFNACTVERLVLQREDGTTLE